MAGKGAMWAWNWLALGLVVVAGAGRPQAARAVDGVIEINHARALAGAVTLGDAPGYPVTLSAPGSYRLTSNLTPPAGSGGIDITTSVVTIDLNDFLIRGTSLCTGSPVDSCSIHGGPGIFNQGRSGITIRNGSVVGMDDGILMTNGNVTTTVEGVVVLGNNGAGIIVGPFSTVSGCRAGRNFGYGIQVGESSKVFENDAHENNAQRIFAGPGSTVSRNTVHLNGGGGISAGAPALVDRNVVSQNNSYGIVGNSGNGRVRIESNVMAANVSGSFSGTDISSAGNNTCDDAVC